jgi:hypothetical protein
MIATMTAPSPAGVWLLFMSDPLDFILIIATVIVPVVALVWWLRGHLAKERIATLQERLRLAEDRKAKNAHLHSNEKEVTKLGPEASDALEIIVGSGGYFETKRAVGLYNMEHTFFVAIKNNDPIKFLSLQGLFGPSRQ